MGNVNGREDGAGSPSAAEEESGGAGGEGHAHVRAVSAGGGDGSSELIGQSPPHSPRGSTHSPLMFTPQVPVVPLQRPDEIHVPNNSWMQSSGFEDMCSEQGIPTMITWSYGGKDVSVEGSWDNWKTRMPLQRSGKDFTIMKVLPSGVYQYRFIVDGQWRCSPDFPLAQDDAGNSYNLLDLQ